MSSPPPADNSEIDDLPILAGEEPVQDSVNASQSDEMGGVQLDAEIDDSDAGVFDLDEASRDALSVEVDDFPLLPLRVAASGFEAVNPEAFAKLGVRESETRVVTIRNAAKRAASQILAAHRSGTVGDLTDPLADLAWTTYRLIDPRFRLAPFQQIRVGRILPLTLTQAAVWDLADLSVPSRDQAHSTSDPVPVLFGHRLPVVVFPATNDPATNDLANANSNEVLASESQESSANALLAPPMGLEPRHRGRKLSEAMQAYTELRGKPSRFAWQRVVHDSRFLLGMITVTSVAAALLLFFAIRQSTKPTRVIAQQTAGQGTVTDPESLGSASPPETEILPAPIRTPNSSPNSSPNSNGESVQIPHAMAEPIAPTANEGMAETSAEPSSELGAASETEIKLPPTIPFVGPPIDALLLKISPPEPSIDEVAETMPTSESTLTPDRPRTVIPWDSEEVEAAIAELWDRTPSVARRFTSASAAELIDQWDFDAELAGFGSIEHAAASSLALRAAWLAEPFASLVNRIREQGPIRDLGPGQSADGSGEANGQPCCHLSFSELQMLLQSWMDARGRVVITNDLDQLLHQSNVLIDRILVSDQISAFERADLVRKMMDHAERLARIARDKIAIAESNQLAAALDAFPDASELERLESADDSSGFLGRVRCLKQRQWDAGLESLGRTSDPAIASCAKSEWELARSDTTSPDQWIQLAARWSKVAVRLPEREAAAVRLHAINLYGDSEEYAGKRNELQSALPRYMAPLVEL